MVNKLICTLALLLGCGAGVSPAVAKGCSPLKMLASAKLVSQPGYLQTIPVTVNGTPKQFILDTGGIYTQIGPNAAKDLHLVPQWGATPIYDASKNVSESFVKLDTLELGGMTAKDVYLRISPSNLGADGLIAPDVLDRYDVEMDFAGGKLNYFLPDHCFGKVIYWPHGDVAQVPIVLADKRWIKVPVTLDGKSLMAVIDTGATSTIITDRTARDSFGLTPNSPGMTPAGNVNGDAKLASYAHTFSSLTLDGITIKNPRLIVMPDRVTDTDGPRYRYFQVGNQLYSQKRMEAPAVTLGMDVLKYLHLYFAFAEHNLYATAAEVPPPPVSEAPAKSAGDTPAKRPKLSPPVLAPLREAQDALKNKDYPAALAAVAKAKAVPELAPFDALTIHRFEMSIHAGMKDLAAAMLDAEAAADADPSVIPDADKAIVYKAALQLTLHEKQYDKAVKYAKLYQATYPPASDQPLIAAAMAHAGPDSNAAR